MPKWWTSLSPLAKTLSIIAILIGIALIAIASWQNAQGTLDRHAAHLSAQA
jgi:1,4-dihydroxy-2-naphthoate octaprenyltransferase